MVMVKCLESSRTVNSDDQARRIDKTRTPNVRNLKHVTLIAAEIQLSIVQIFARVKKNYMDFNICPSYLCHLV